MICKNAIVPSNNRSAGLRAYLRIFAQCRRGKILQYENWEPPLWTSLGTSKNLSTQSKPDVSLTSTPLVLSADTTAACLETTAYFDPLDAVKADGFVPPNRRLLTMITQLVHQTKGCCRRHCTLPDKLKKQSRCKDSRGSLEKSTVFKIAGLGFCPSQQPQTKLGKILQFPRGWLALKLSR